MNKKDLMETYGLTEEQADELLAERGRELNPLRNRVNELEVNATELETLRNEKLTEEERVQKSINDANEREAKYTKELNKLKAQQILTQGGLSETDYSDMLDILVGADETITTKNCNSFVAKINAKVEAKEKSLREELLKGATPPEGSEGGAGKTKTKEELYAEELANEGKQAIESSKATLEYYGGGN